MRGSPGLTITAVITLALGIAVNTTVFGWIDAVLLNPIPGAARADELATLETVTPTGGLQNTSYRDYRDYRDKMRQVSGLAASLTNAFTVGSEQNPRLLWGEFVSANYFQVMGVKPIRGRTFGAEEFGDAAGGPPVVVISQRLWRSEFQDDPAVIGKTLRVNQRELTVIGIVPAEFHGTVPGLMLEMWLPVALAPQMNGQGPWLLEARNERQMWVTARLRPGVKVEQASAEAAACARRIAEAHPETSRAFSSAVLPIWRGHLGAQRLLRTPLQILMVVSLLLFLIVGANVANLQLARAAGRQKEFSIRLALGARPQRLVRQLLTESMLLSAAGGAGGVLLAMWSREALAWLLPPSNLPLVMLSGSNWHIVGCVVLLCAAATVLTGVAPALHSARTGVSEHLKQNSRGSTSGAGARRTRSALVISEVALAMVALVGTGAALRIFFHDRTLGTGMDTRSVACAKYYVETFCRTAEERRRFCSRLAERLRVAPGVSAVSYSNFVPLGFDETGERPIAVEGYAPARNEAMQAGNSSVSPGYFDTLGIPLVEGRDFREQDDRKSARVMIVNEAFARRYFRGRTVVGGKVSANGEQFTVIGLVRDSKYRQLTEGRTPYFYTSCGQSSGGEFWMAFFVRTAGPPASAVAALGRVAASLESATRSTQFVPYQDWIGAAVYSQRVAATLLGVVGTISLLLSAIGLYSVLAFAVSRRTSEFGIRMALGAATWQVLSIVLRQGMALTLAGLCAGAVAAVAVLRISSALVPEFGGGDLPVFAGAITVLGVVALLASYLPARRATNVNPVQALRQE